MGRETTHVRVYERDADRLHDLKDRGDTFPDVVEQLLDENERHRTSDRDAQLTEQDTETEETTS